jgi:hypothetical protein
VTAVYDSVTDQLYRCGSDACPCATDERYVDREGNKHAEMVARLRKLAEELRWANGLYEYATEFGMWNPANAEYEANYLETHQ